MIRTALMLAVLSGSPELDPAWSSAAGAECPARVRCFDIVAHVVVTLEGPVVDAAWLAERVTEANRHFAGIEVGFRLARVESHPADFADVATRDQRDAIGRDRYDTGPIHLHLVRRLDDVDVEGEVIRGVHWRDRRDVSRRWIIMSALAGPGVLTHELGHFFGLPHSSHPRSIMNKREDPGRPPADAWTFVEAERERMRGFVTWLLYSRELAAHPPRGGH
jgi:hypothetical protein